MMIRDVTRFSGQSLRRYPLRSSMLLLAIAIGVASDLNETRPRWATGDRFIRDAHVSPTGARAVLGHRGFLSVKTWFSGEPGHSSAARALQDNANHEMARWAARAIEVAAAQGRALGPGVHVVRREAGHHHGWRALRPIEVPQRFSHAALKSKAHARMLRPDDQIVVVGEGSRHEE